MILSMKKSIIASAILFLFAGIAICQDKPDIEKNRKVATIYHDLKAENIDKILTEDFKGRQEQDKFTWDRERHRNYLSNSNFKRDSIFLQVAEGNWVATRFFREMDYQGNRIKVEAMHFKRFEDGKIAEIWEYGDRSQFEAKAPPKTAQSPDESLDQAELLKQFAGTWKADFAKDTTIVWKVSPSDNGYESLWKWKANGETYSTVKGIIGFTWKNQKVNMFHLFPNGWIGRDLGGFVSEKKLVMERFTADHSVMNAKMEFKFMAPDKFHQVFKWRGSAEKPWDKANVMEATFTKVKE